MGRPVHDPGQRVSGRAIRFERFRIQMTGEQLGELCNVSESTVYAWEAGRWLPTAAQLELIAKALRCTKGKLAVEPR